MKINSLIRFSVKNIRRHPVKNLLIGLLIFLGTLVFLINSSMETHARKTWHNYFATTFTGDFHISAYSKNDRDYTLPGFSLPKKGIPTGVSDYLKKQGIQFSRRIKLGAAIFNEKKGEFEGSPVTITGLEIQKELPYLTNIKMLEGSFADLGKNEIVVWQELANKQGWHKGSEVTLYLRDNDNNSYPYTFIIKGIFDHHKGASLEGKGVMLMFPLLYASYEDLALKLSIPEEKVLEIAVRHIDGKQQENIETMAQAENLQFFSGAQGFGVVWGIVEFVSFIGLFLAIFILVLLIISNLNLNMLGFLERQKEIGSILAMGGTPFFIFGFLLLEMLIFAILIFASAVGVFFLLSQVFALQFNFGEMSLFFAGNPLSLYFELAFIQQAFLTILFTLLISAAYPLYLSCKINPIEVFREAERP